MGLPSTLYRQLMRFARGPIVVQVPFTLPPYTLSVPHQLNPSYFPADATIPKTHTVPKLNAKTLPHVIRAIFVANKNTQSPLEITAQTGQAFEAIKELSAFKLRVIDVSYAKHREALERKTVPAFFVGQVARHKTLGWRGVIVGWEELDDCSIQYRLLPDLSDSLHLPLQNRSTQLNALEASYPTIECSEDDLTSSPPLPPNLRRLSPDNMGFFFENFDPISGTYFPNPELRYLFPKDNNWDHYQEDILKSDPPRDRAAERVSLGAQGVARKILAQIGVSVASSDNKNDVLLNLEHKLSEIVAHEHTRRGSDFQNGNEIERLNVLDSSLSQTDFRIHDCCKILSKLCDVYRELNTMVNVRDRCIRGSNDLKFSVGDVVHHKLFNFRGVITSIDPVPRFDVTNWDGVQHIEDVMSKPFYTIIPDENDAELVFQGIRHPRYVCEENLDAYNKSEHAAKSRFAPMKELVASGGVTYDWREDCYIPSTAVKFQHDMLGEEMVKEITDVHDCFQGCLVNINSNSSKNCNNGDASMINVDNLLELLVSANSKSESSTIEEILRAVWLVHEDVAINKLMEESVLHLNRRKFPDAKQILEKVVEQTDGQYSEGLYKLATCQHLMGEVDTAFDTMGKVMQIEDRHIFALLGASLAKMKLEKFTEARDILVKLLALHPWCSASTHLMICEERLEMEAEQQSIDDAFFEEEIGSENDNTK